MLNSNLKWMVVIIPIYFCLGKMGELIMGPYSTDFATPWSSMIHVTLTGFGRFNSGDGVMDKGDEALLYYSILYFIAIFWTFNMYLAFGLKIYYENMLMQGFHTPTLKGGGKHFVLSNFFSFHNQNFYHRPGEVYIFLCPRENLEEIGWHRRS
jgi:hypothetical protein